MSDSKPQSPTQVVSRSATRLQAIAARIEDITDTVRLYAGYGAFMVAWAEFEAVIEVAIMRETKMDPTHSIIVCSGLAFERKASILRSLLALHGDGHKATVTLLNRIVTEAERNALVHSLAVGDPKKLELLRRTTDQKLSIKVKAFDGPGMQSKVESLRARIEELKALLSISPLDLRAYESKTRSLASS